MMGCEGDVTESERMKWIGNGGAMHVCGSGTTIAGITLSVDSLWFRVGKKSTCVN
jgi:hypothetical protein